MNTPHHHIGVLKHSPQGGYCCEILGKEFNYSDQLFTVISSIYNHSVAEVNNF